MSDRTWIREIESQVELSQPAHRFHSFWHLGGRGRPPSRRLGGTRRLCGFMALEGGCPQPPGQGPMREGCPANPAVGGLAAMCWGG